MKKLAIGCGIVLVLALIALGVGVFWVAHKAQTVIAGLSELKNIPDLDKQIRNTTPFSPPASGELSSEQVSRYVAVREQVRQQLGARAKELDAQYKALAERMDKHQQTPLDIPQMIEAYKDLAGLYILGKRAQVAALNDKNLSLGEYRWIQQQAYTALGMPFVDMDISKMIEETQSGRSPSPGDHQARNLPPGASDKNKSLVEPHRKLLEDSASLSFLGL
jgi:hypothetical protein